MIHFKVYSKLKFAYFVYDHTVERYEAWRTNCPYDEKLNAYIRQSLIKKYGKKVFYEIFLKNAPYTYFRVCFGEHDTIFLNLSARYDFSKNYTPLNYLMDIKSVVDSLALCNETLYLQLNIPYDFQTSSYDLLSKEKMEHDFRRYMSSSLKNNLYFGPLEINIKENRYLFYYEKVMDRNFLYGFLREDYENECEKRGVKSISNYNNQATKYNEDEINLLIDYICVYDKWIINEKPSKVVFTLPFSYSPKKYIPILIKE